MPGSLRHQVKSGSCRSGSAIGWSLRSIQTVDFARGSVMSSPVTQDGLEQAADKAAAAGDFAAAKSLLEQAVQADGATHHLWMKLSAMRKASGDPRGALQAIDQSLALNPLDFPALLSRAMVLEIVGDPAAGQEFG